MVSKELSRYHAVSNLLDVEKWWAASSPEIEFTYHLQIIGPHLVESSTLHPQSTRPHSEEDTLRRVVAVRSKDKKRRWCDCEMVIYEISCEY